MRTLVGLLFLGVAAFALTACGAKESKTAAGRKLELQQPSSVKLRQGETAKVGINLSRSNVPDTVTIVFSNLPPGVSVVENDTRLTGDSGTFTLRAAPDAPTIETHLAQVRATAQDAVSGVQEFNVSVQAVEMASGR